MIVTLIGYLASLLLALSLIVSNDLKFRWFNLFGCIAFIIYGVMIGAFPVILTNAMLLLINLFYLVRIYRSKETFDLVAIAPDSELVARFVQFYQKDLATYFPHFSLAANPNQVCFLVLRNMTLANLFIAEKTGNGEATVLLDYTTPRSRDYKAAGFIINGERNRLLSAGIERLIYKGEVTAKHTSFLKKMGFGQELRGGGTVYSKSLVSN
jgi:hypothetical protein